MFIVIQLILLALATDALLQVWFTGSIFNNIQVYCESRLLGLESSEGEDSGQETFIIRWLARCPDLFIELISCRYCLSHHVPYILLGLFFVPSLFVPVLYSHLFMFPIYSLAVTRMSNVFFSFHNDSGEV